MKSVSTNGTWTDAVVPEHGDALTAAWGEDIAENTKYNKVQISNLIDDEMLTLYWDEAAYTDTDETYTTVRVIKAYVPQSKPHLHFHSIVGSTGDVAPKTAWCQVLVNSTSVDAFESTQGTGTGYITRYIDLSVYIGQLVTIEIQLKKGTGAGNNAQIYRMLLALCHKVQLF